MALAQPGTAAASPYRVLGILVLNELIFTYPALLGTWVKGWMFGTASLKVEQQLRSLMLEGKEQFLSIQTGLPSYCLHCILLTVLLTLKNYNEVSHAKDYFKIYVNYKG